MLEFLYQRLDFIFFVYAALLLLVSKKSFINSRLEKGNNLWFFLSLFSLLYGFKFIIDAVSLSGYDVNLVSDILTAASFLILIEYMISNTRSFYSNRYLRLTTVWLTLLLVLMRILMGQTATDFATRVFLCLLGGIGACIKILHSARSDELDRYYRKTLYLVAFFLFAFCTLQFAELNTDANIKWLYKSQPGLVVILLGILFATGLLFFTERYLNKKCLSLGVKRKSYISYTILFAMIVLCWVFTEKLADHAKVEFGDRLINRAATAAAAVNPIRVAHLTLSKKDENSSDFIRLKEQLSEVRRINKNVRFLYLTTVKDGKVFFQLDSEDPKSPDYSAPGDLWGKAPEAVRLAYINGDARINGPYTDEWGTWVSAFIAIKDFKTHQVVSVLGMDIDVRARSLALIQSRRLGIMAGLVLFICLLVFFIIYELGQIAAEEIKKSEEKFFTVFQRSPVLTSISALEDGRFIDVNNTFCTVLGYEKHEIIGKTSIELGIFKDWKARGIIKDNTTKEGFVENFEMEMPTKDGGTIIGLYYGTAIDIDGKKCLVSVIEDITKKKRDEELIKEKTEELNRFFNVSQDILCMEDIKGGRFIRVSRSCEKLLGYTVEEMENKRFIDFVHPDDITATNAASASIANGMELTGFSNRYRCKDGSYKWLEWYATPYAGQVIYATARDVTFKQKTLAALKENEEKYRSVVDNINMGISLIDRSMNILSANSKMRELFPQMDFSKEYCCYKTYNVPPREEPCTYCPVIKTFEDGQIHSVVVDTVIGHKVVYYKIMSCPVKDAEGDVVAAIEIVENITEQTILHNIVRENESYFRTIWNSLQAGVVIVDVDTYKIVDANPAALGILKARSREDVIGKTCSEYICQNDCEHCPVIAQGKEIKNKETEIIDTEGKKIPVIKTVELMELKGKKLLLENFIDVTKLKVVQERLKESEERFRDIAVNTSDLVWEFDANGVYSYCSDNVFHTLGYTKEEFVGMQFLALIPADIRDDVKKAFVERVKRKDPLIDYENRFVRKDGREIIGQLNAAPILNDKGDLLGYRGVAKDITEKKKIENTLRQLSRAVEQSPACIVIANTDGNIEYVNPKFTELTGYSFEEAKGQNPRILKAGDMPNDHYKMLWDTITSGNEWKGELHNKKKSGELYWELASISPVKDAQGKTTNYLAVKEDITERKKLEAALHESQEALLRASKVKDDFLSITSHDLKSPLGIVKTSMNLLLDEEKVPPTIKEYAEVSLRQANKGLQLISDLLDLEKLERGDVKLEVTRFDFSRLVEEIIKDFSSTYKQSGVTLEAYSEGDYEVMADYHKIGQVISNLLGNALKYTSKGGKVSINTTLVEKQEANKQSGNYLKVSVVDTGEGVPAEKLSKIFEKYEQAATKDRKTGTGIGLSIARYICELHHGEIWVESELGKGSTLSFTIPYSKETQELYYDDPSALPYRILIVDDMDDHRFVARTILRKDHFPCEEAGNWRDALDKVRTGKFALALLDIDMPELNGYELLEIIRREKTPKQLPIIMLSSKESDKDACAKHGVTCFIKKDNAGIELVKNIKKILNIK